VQTQCYNAVLLHDSLPAANCKDWWSAPNNCASQLLNSPWKKALQNLRYNLTQLTTANLWKKNTYQNLYNYKLATKKTTEQTRKIEDRSFFITNNLCMKKRTLLVLRSLNSACQQWWRWNDHDRIYNATDILALLSHSNVTKNVAILMRSQYD